MDKSEVIGSVASDLHATEKAIDTAITQATTLVQSMIGARTALQLSPVSGAGSQAKAMESIAALSTARDAIVACHAELQKDHRRMGWGVYAVGPVNKPDDWETPIGGTPPKGHLTRVA
ncbi:MAG TPA: hypothetical protein PLQ03_06335 [Brevundimonas sp.]|uniref:hypothetical protein n=1 Tax=Brevundimonas sp. TaxID=1871086 RepID=UPI0026130478|nr:hypothetical protein [Brevundimonas sp.]HRO33014.1 hypothetical protein [Brevundimonas sp.]